MYLLQKDRENLSKQHSFTYSPSLLHSIMLCLLYKHIIGFLIQPLENPKISRQEVMTQTDELHNLRNYL